jgi:hypothetical protein
VLYVSPQYDQSRKNVRVGSLSNLVSIQRICEMLPIIHVCALDRVCRWFSRPKSCHYWGVGFSMGIITFINVLLH